MMMMMRTPVGAARSGTDSLRTGRRQCKRPAHGDGAREKQDHPLRLHATRAEQPGIVILMPDARIIEVLAHGEMAALTRKGDAAVQEFFLARFLKTDK